VAEHSVLIVSSPIHLFQGCAAISYLIFIMHGFVGQIYQCLKLASNLAIANRSRVSYAHKVVTEMTFKGHSRSSKRSRFDRAHIISYYRSIVTMALSSIVTHIAKCTYPMYIYDTILCI